ncbi:MAG: hypothetical protein ACRDZO_13740 [Egibacteraceae bacterium]
MGYLVVVYLIYVGSSVGLSLWLARMLSRNGAAFLEDVFRDRPELAGAVNRLLVAGFSMLNLGYAFIILRAEPAAGPVEALEILAHKLGSLLLSLAVLHFVNLLIFSRIRRRAAVPGYPEVR